jgi:hypothetical protein
MNATKILDKMNLPDDIRHHPNVVLAEEQAKLDWWVIGLLQGFYMLGVAATGYATFDLFLKAGFPFLAAIGAAVVIDAFGVVAATLSTRARLRNQTDLSTRAIVYLGAVASGVMNYLFHSEAMLKIGLPIVVVLSMVCWVRRGATIAARRSPTSPPLVCGAPRATRRRAWRPARVPSPRGVGAPRSWVWPAARPGTSWP